MNVAFLGTGLMGAPMARNILAAGFSLIAWNRSPEKAHALEVHGAKVALAAEDAVRQADLIITMLSDGPAVESLLFSQRVAAHIRKGAAVVDMSSIRPTEARDHAARLLIAGIRHVDAPVSGGTKGAEAGTLAIMAGGDAEVFESLRPVLSAMGRPVLVGPSGSGQLAKLANQAIVAVTIGVVAEADLLGLKLPLAEALTQRFARLVEDMGGGDLDHSALFCELLAENGL